MSGPWDKYSDGPWAKYGGKKSDPLRAIGLLNTGIARTFDGLAGPLNRGVNAVLGTELSETPTADAFGMTGVATRQPENMGERALGSRWCSGDACSGHGRHACRAGRRGASRRRRAHSLRPLQ